MDTLITLIDIKEGDGELNEDWDFFITVTYNSINDVESIPYLLGNKQFPKSHYDLRRIGEISFELLKEKLTEIHKKISTLRIRALEFNKAKEKDKSLIADLNPSVNWNEWLDDLNHCADEINEATTTLCD